MRAKTAADCIVMRAIRRRGETTCDHCAEHDPVTDAPLGPRCGKLAAGVIFWRGTPRRYSVSCSEHGVESLDASARDLVLVYLPF